MAREQDRAIPVSECWERGPGAADTAVLPAHGGASPVFSFVAVARVIVPRRTHGAVGGNTGTFLLQRWGELLGTAAARAARSPPALGGGPGLSKCQKVQIQAWPLTKNCSAAEDPGGVLCVPTASTKRPSPLLVVRRVVRTVGPGDTRRGGRWGVSPRALSAGIAPRLVTRDECPASATASHRAGAGIGTESKPGRGHRDHPGAKIHHKSDRG